MSKCIYYYLDHIKQLIKSIMCVPHCEFTDLCFSLLCLHLHNLALNYITLHYKILWCRLLCITCIKSCIICIWVCFQATETWSVRLVFNFRSSFVGFEVCSWRDDIHWDCCHCFREDDQLWSKPSGTVALLIIMLMIPGR